MTDDLSSRILAKRVPIEALIARRPAGLARLRRAEWNNFDNYNMREDPATDWNNWVNWDQDPNPFNNKDDDD